MLTESSKPTIAKEGQERRCRDHRPELETGVIGDVRNSNARETSPCPAPDRQQADEDDDQQCPTTSTQVSTTFAFFTLSPTPRKLTTATSADEGQPQQRDAAGARKDQARRPARNWRRKARDAVAEEVMPEHITAKATMKVKK